jgi:hypothetical protein
MCNHLGSCHHTRLTFFGALYTLEHGGHLCAELVSIVYSEIQCLIQTNVVQYTQCIQPNVK